MAKPDLPAFPSIFQDHRGDYVRDPGMSLREWFATFAPQPSEADIGREMKLDITRNPHNYPNKPKLRNTYEIIADLKWKYADAMIDRRPS